VLSFLGLGCIVGLLSGLLGIGGGIILVPVFTLLFTYQAIPSELVIPLAGGTSLATMTLSTFTSGLRHHSKGAVNWPMLWYLVPGTGIGAVMGVQFASSLPGLAVQIVFGVVVCGVALNMILGQPTAHYRAAILGIKGWLFLGIVVGFCAGLLGIGGGVLLVPLLCFLGVNLTQASATASMCTFPTVLIGALTAIVVGWGVPGLPSDTLGFVYWPAIWMVGLTSILFALIGVELSHRLPVKILRKIFGIILIGLVISWLALKF
jgi:uncharacterized membrane protein YfcA